MALTAVDTPAPDQSMREIDFAALVSGAINPPAVRSWTLVGPQMARLLTDPQRLTLFNWTMTTLLVASLYPVV